ncbi:VWFA domain-containing protein [Sulfidibacter corallicola]|uniref:VWFA domain-containing protein n=1 Tax=Sulfidibacter corallicola TaxID=2818388 RepID=A0A8A4TZ53_SULCO|nr:hypothetical protein [Sulfidibacter corallicola]QTD51795.1 hypothetical protein J3U87_04935 [Sulfidibacter corallicola]
MKPGIGWTKMAWCLAALLFWNPSGKAEPGLDLLVAVDQSGSMSRFHGHGKRLPPNDPSNMRNQMIGMILDHLYNDQRTSRVVHRLCVVGFGDSVWVSLPFTSVTDRSIARLREVLEPESLYRDSSETRMMRALRTGTQHFRRLPGDPERVRQMIIITDGRPAFVGYRDIREKYKAQLADLIQTELEDVAIWVFGLNAAGSDYWDEYGPFWARVTGGHAEKLDQSDAESVYSRLCEALSICGDNWLPGQNRFIPPYLDSVVLNVFKTESDHGVLFYPPNETDPLDETRMEVTRVGPNLETVLIKRPTPGLWKIRKTHFGDKVQVRVKQFFVRGALESPHAQQRLRRTERTRIRYRVIDDLGQPVVEHPDYPLSLQLALVDPDGAVQDRVSMKAAASEDPGLFETVVPVSLEREGTYRAEILVGALDHQGHPIEIYRDRYAKFKVGSGDGVRAQPILPNPPAVPLWGFWMFTRRTQPFTWEFRDEAGQPVPLDSLTHDAFFTMDLVHPNGHRTAVPLLREEPHRLGGSVALPWWPPGTYRLDPKLDPVLIKQRYIVSLPTAPTPSVEVVLTPWHLVQLGCVVLLLLAGLSGAVWRTYRTVRFPLVGTLTFEQHGSFWKYPIPISRKWRHRMVLKAKDLPARTNIHELAIRSQADALGGIVVSARGPQKEVLLESRVLTDGTAASLDGAPFLVRYESGTR